MTTATKLQEVIINNGGFILSDGTLNLQHLLPKAYDLLSNYEIDKPELKQEILDCFELEYYGADKEFSKEQFIDKELSLFVEQYHGDAELMDDKQELASYLWNEDIFNLFNNIAPTGYYFGSSEGDGACIGWFKFEDEETFTDEEMEEADEYLKE
jgi:hypothetical protein